MRSRICVSAQVQMNAANRPPRHASVIPSLMKMALVPTAASAAPSTPIATTRNTSATASARALSLRRGVAATMTRPGGGEGRPVS